MKARTRSNTRIDRTTPISLSFQIAESLRESLPEDKMRQCDLLTADERVQEEFEVSRATAHEAIDELVDEGLVERITRKGSFVAEPRLQAPLPAMLSVTEGIKRRVKQPCSCVVFCRLGSCARPQPGSNVERRFRKSLIDQPSSLGE